MTPMTLSLGLWYLSYPMCYALRILIQIKTSYPGLLRSICNLLDPKGTGEVSYLFQGISLLNGKKLAEKLPLCPTQRAGQWQA